MVQKPKTDVAAAFAAWLSTIEAEPFPPDVVAVNVGLFETDDGFSAYLSGSRVYDPDDDSWALNEDFVPKAKFFSLGPTFRKMSWQDVLSTCRTMLRAYLADHPESKLHALAAVSLGFDDGDLERIT